MTWPCGSGSRRGSRAQVCRPAPPPSASDRTTSTCRPASSLVVRSLDTGVRSRLYRAFIHNLTQEPTQHARRLTGGDGLKPILIALAAAVAEGTALAELRVEVPECAMTIQLLAVPFRRRPGIRAGIRVRKGVGRCARRATVDIPPAEWLAEWNLVGIRLHVSRWLHGHGQCDDAHQENQHSSQFGLRLQLMNGHNR